MLMHTLPQHQVKVMSYRAKPKLLRKRPYCMEDLLYFIILKVNNTPAYPTRLPNLDGVNFLWMIC